MSAPVTSRDRWLALGLLLLVVAAAWMALAQPWVSERRALSRAIASVQAEIDSQRAAAGRYRENTRRLEALQDDPAITSYFLTRQSPAVAAASLQQSLRQAIARANGQLVSIQVVGPGATTEPPLPVRLRVQLRGDSPALQALLADLESGVPLLMIEELVVQRLAASRTLANPGGEHLDIRFQVTGFLREAP